MQGADGRNGCAYGVSVQSFICTKTGGPVGYARMFDEDRFSRWLTNDWVHLERKVAALESKVTMLLGGTGIIIGLMVYAVTK